MVSRRHLKEFFSEAKFHGGSIEQSLLMDLEKLAKSCHDAGQYSRAESLYRWVICLMEDTNSPSWRLAICVNHLADLLSELGKYEEADPLFLRAIQLWQKFLGNENYALALCMRSYADCLGKTGRTAEAHEVSLRSRQLLSKVCAKDVAMSNPSASIDVT